MNTFAEAFKFDNITWSSNINLFIYNCFLVMDILFLKNTFYLYAIMASSSNVFYPLNF